jgi:hypothetical protein
LALPAAGWAWGLEPVGTRKSTANRLSNPWSFEKRFRTMVVPSLRKPHVERILCLDSGYMAGAT